jgi:hypothetical protein
MSDIALSNRTPREPARATGAQRLLPEQLEHTGSFEIVVPYVGLDLTAKVVGCAAALATGLNVALKVVAVYVVPYPADLRCPLAMKEHLTGCLTEIAEKSSLPASIHLVVCRDRSEGLLRTLRPGSAVLLGSRRRVWRTQEEKLARQLVRQGQHVSLIHFD